MSPGIIDLHSHSTASDGALSPSALIRRAVECRVGTLALTDHDTVDGLEEASQTARDSGLTLIPGIELSCVWNGVTLHVLGLNIDPNARPMQAAVAAQKENRTGRAKVIAEKLSKLGFGSVWEKVSEVAGARVPNRPDFAKYLVDHAYVTTVQQAFERYLGAGKMGDVKQFWPPLEQIVYWINASGGVAVLAHPMKYEMTTAKLRRLLEDFKHFGGRGLEISVPNLDSGRIGLLGELCRTYALHGSCGSDFHTVSRFGQDLGRFPQLPASVLPVWKLWQKTASD
jgi:3',5'-nucleoside bisphosphate phosphatase